MLATKERNAPPTNTADVFLKKIDDASIDVRDRQVEALQRDLSAEKDARKEDRFFFVFGTVIMLDFALFANAENWVVPLVLVVLQTLFLGLLAKKMGMDEMYLIFDRFIGRVADGIGSRKDDAG